MTYSLGDLIKNGLIINPNTTTPYTSRGAIRSILTALDFQPSLDPMSGLYEYHLTPEDITTINSFISQYGVNHITLRNTWQERQKTKALETENQPGRGV